MGLLGWRTAAFLRRRAAEERERRELEDGETGAWEQGAGDGDNSGGAGGLVELRDDVGEHTKDHCGEDLVDGGGTGDMG